MKRTWKQIGSLFLVFCMVFAMMPTVAFAETGTVDSGTPRGMSGTITAFAPLDEDVAGQTVEIGKPEDKPNLPDELIATLTEGGDDTATGSDAAKETQTTVEVSEWTCDPAYDGDAEGVYTFTPMLTLSDGVTVAEGVNVPTITVTVGKAAGAQGDISLFAEGDPSVFNVTNATELKSKLSIEYIFPVIINVTEDITLSEAVNVGKNITLTIQSGKTLTIDNNPSDNPTLTIRSGGPLTVNGAGTLTVKNSNTGYGIFVYGWLNIENLGTLSVQNTGGLSIGIYGYVTIKGSTVNISNINNSGYDTNIGINSDNLTIDNSKVTINASASGYGNVAGVVSSGKISIINDSTVTINTNKRGIEFELNPGSLTVDDSTLDLQSGVVLDLNSANQASFTSANNGIVRLTQGAVIYAADGKMKDQGNVLMEKNITVAAADATPSGTGLTAGDYVWDGTYFTKVATEPVGAETPSIRTQPIAATYARDESAKPLTIEASVDGDGTLSYQWYSNASSSNTGGTPIDGATSITYTPSTATVGITYYYCVVTNTDNSVSDNQTASVTSSAVAIVVNETPATYTISGTITGSDTGSGVAGAIIELKDEYGDSVAITGAGPTGEYNFDNILAGTYNIEVNAPDYNGSISVITVLNYDITNHNFILVRPDYYGIYGLVVGDVVVTAENKDNIIGSAITGTISYNPATKTLTLENATIGMSSYHPIVSTEDLTVRLIDSSVLGIVWSDDQGGQIGTGISGYKNITLTGDGNLTIYNNESGIQAKNITIDMGGTLTIDELGSSGMACTLKANGGTITINKGTLNLKSKLSNGLYGNSIVINGGNITAYSEDGNNAGLFAFNRAPSFSRDYWYKVYAGNDQASAVDITAPNSQTYTNSKYVRIEQSPEGTGLRGGGHGGGGGSSSGGDSGGSTTPPTPPAPPTSPNVSADGSVSQSAITGEATSALGATTGTTATVRTQGASEIGPAALDALAGAGAQAGRQVVLHADTMTGSAVQGRLYVEPARLTGRTEPLKLGVYTEPAKTAATTGLFERFFDNNITTISLEQQGSFGTSLQIAAKVDLSELDVTALVFYSYDKATNTYRRIEKPAYWVDTNGYLHFTTELAGDIIISNGPLALK